MHSEGVGDRLQSVITGGIGRGHAALWVIECFAVIVQRLCQGATLQPRDFPCRVLGYGFQFMLHRLHERIRAQKYLPPEMVPDARATNAFLNELDIACDLAGARSAELAQQPVRV